MPSKTNVHLPVRARSTPRIFFFVLTPDLVPRPPARTLAETETETEPETDADTEAAPDAQVPAPVVENDAEANTQAAEPTTPGTVKTMKSKFQGDAAKAAPQVRARELPKPRAAAAAKAAKPVSSSQKEPTPAEPKAASKIITGVKSFISRKPQAAPEVKPKARARGPIAALEKAKREKAAAEQKKQEKTNRMALMRANFEKLQQEQQTAKDAKDTSTDKAAAQKKPARKLPTTAKGQVSKIVTAKNKRDERSRKMFETHAAQQKVKQDQIQAQLRLKEAQTKARLDAQKIRLQREEREKCEAQEKIDQAKQQAEAEMRRKREELKEKQRRLYEEQEKRQTKIEEQKRKLMERIAEQKARQQEEKGIAPSAKKQSSFTPHRFNKVEAAPFSAMKAAMPESPQSYDISDLVSDCSTDEEDEPKQQVPKWAKGGALRTALYSQIILYNKDGSDIFDEVPPPDLCDIFPKKQARLRRPRTSSALWSPSPTKGGLKQKF